MNRPLEPNEPRTTSTIVEPFTQSAVDKIDLVLAIDNSRSMADKQQILASAVPDLVKGLVNPKCLDPTGVPAAMQPNGPLEVCAPGTKREFEPVLNIHIGIISSSLGGHGSDSCSTADTQACGGPNPSNNDAGHLLSRMDPCGGANVPTYQNKGFLAWDPAGKLMPPGEKNIGDAMTPGIVKTLTDMVIGAGQVGCGYEAQMESWYRFLVDPQPYKDISVQGGKATPTGIDDLLLKQRADFLRPSSLLAIIMLTDENDCSIKESGQYYFAAQQRLPSDNKKTFHLPRARQECATDPNNKCCVSCGQKVPDGCPADDKCTASPTLSDIEDDINLRCWNQKQRFGIDFLYGIDRYTKALTELNVQNRQGELVQNPIFNDLNPNDDDSNIRDSSLVFLAGIVGVPWQLISRTDSMGNPDLLNGLNTDQKPVGGFKTFEELNAKGSDMTTGWDKILGDPTKYVLAGDPHMIESVGPRAPLSLAGADPFNGHEYSIPKADDLQYACIFDLPMTRDCTQKLLSCDCQDANNDNPLCDSTTKTTQVKAKGYPGLRELAAIRGVGPQGVVASVCPAQLTNDTAKDYGYRPAIGSIIDRLKVALGGKCLPRQLTADKNGQVQCLIIEARNTGGKCSCPADKARQEVEASHKAAIDAAKAYPIAATANWDCFCEITQTGDPKASSPDELTACQDDVSPTPVIKGTGPDAGKNANGWCYVDATTSPTTGNPDIVKDCPDTEKRLVRFVGEGAPKGNATLFITCTGD